MELLPPFCFCLLDLDEKTQLTIASGIAIPTPLKIHCLFSISQFMVKISPLRARQNIYSRPIFYPIKRMRDGFKFCFRNQTSSMINSNQSVVSANTSLSKSLNNLSSNVGSSGGTTPAAKETLINSPRPAPSAGRTGNELEQ